jgi:hypothetical protein
MPLLWLISQDQNTGYDTYDSAVVCAETEEDAKRIHPDGRVNDKPERKDFSDWAPPEKVRAAILASSPAYGVEAGAVICASFNAG